MFYVYSKMNESSGLDPVLPFKSFIFLQEQKIMFRKNDITRKLTLPAEQIPDCCADTFLAAKAYTLPSQLRQSVGKDLDPECVAWSIRHSALIFVCQVLNEDYNITAGDDE